MFIGSVDWSGCVMGSKMGYVCCMKDLGVYSKENVNMGAAIIKLKAKQEKP